MDKPVPLSSYDSVPLTDETRDRLLGAGVNEAKLAHLTEMGGQGLLLLYQREQDGDDSRPHCFGADYQPESRLCRGCLFAPSCWWNDHDYMSKVTKGLAPLPPGVPDRVWNEKTGQFKPKKAIPPPPAKAVPPPPPKGGARKKAPPPPPPKKTKKSPPPPPSRRTRK